MKKFFFCISLVLTGMMTSCIDKYEEVDADSRPSWLGGSIYAELKNPSEHGLLTGTFTNYLRLIDDLGYDEVLARTGSKTVFPANDEAFERFFKSNDWGVSSYEQLTDVQKKVLLYGSMIDNTMLLDMLPNVSNNTTEPMRGYGLRHFTNMSVIDSIQFVPGSGNEEVRPESMPAFNSYWKKFWQDGVYVVRDNTQPQMVHLTREYMINNGITTLGDQSDYAILTGKPFTDGTASIFNNRVEKGDVTCQNGYIHQMEDVMVPPGNMAQVLRQKDNTKLFSRMVDYYCAPYLDEVTTTRYHDWYEEQVKAGYDMAGVPNPEKIYQVRYMSTNSQDATLQETDDKQMRSGQELLKFDPGWNNYYPQPATKRVGIDYPSMDMGAIFAPSDDAVKKFFLPGGIGAYFIDIYGDKPNTADNIEENLDSLQSKKAQILTAFVNLMMQKSFASSVPSKFETLTTDASENLGMNVGLLAHKDDGKYDITIANNGAVYVINEMIVPDEYQSVMAPASVYTDMRVMDWMIKDGVKNGDFLQVDFKYYLLAMSANYAFFIPSDDAFDLYYLDPTSLGHLKNGVAGTQQADVLHFFFDEKATRQPYIGCNRHHIDLETGEIDPEGTPVTSIREVKTQLVDILNYHTLVLGEGETLGSNGNHFYKTKHGGVVYVNGNDVNGTILSGGQMERPDMFPAPKITRVFNEKNGVAYKLDRVIQGPTASVYSVVNGNTQFSKFREACMGFNNSNILEWAGIKKTSDTPGMPSPQDAYTIFTHTINSVSFACQDYNVKLFNTYNYTLFAPDNTAMAQAEANGLPTWTEIQNLYKKWHNNTGDDEEVTGGDDDEQTVSAEEQADIVKAYEMIRTLRDFVRIHFMTGSVYADQVVEGNRYSSLNTDANGLPDELVVSQNAAGTFTVTNEKAGISIDINGNDQSKVVNKMTRDIWLGKTVASGEKTKETAASKEDATAIFTSSFCAVHQISKPLYGDASQARYDRSWTNASAFQKAMKDYKRKKANHEL